MKRIKFKIAAEFFLLLEEFPLLFRKLFWIMSIIIVCAVNNGFVTRLILTEDISE